MTAETIDTGSDELLASLEDNVLTLTLNRPDSLNAMTPLMMRCLSAQLADAELNPEVRAIVLTGAGKGFCAGGDVKAMADRNAKGEALTLDQRIQRQRVNQRSTAGRLYKMPKPTLAVINGAAAGAGLSLALSCDMRIMAAHTVMVTAFTNVGFSGDFGGTLFLTELVGTSKARELYYLSERVKADEALKLGMTNWVADAEELPAKSREIAVRLAQGPTTAFQYMKENFIRALESGNVDDCLDVEATHHVHCAKTEDHQNAVKAFMEKRKPEFTGR